MTVSREEMLAQFQPRDLDDRVRHIDAFEEGETVYVKLNRRTFIAAVAALRSQGASGELRQDGIEALIHAICPHIKQWCDETDMPTVCNKCPATVKTSQGQGVQMCRLNAEAAAKDVLALASQAPSEAGMVHRTSEPASAVIGHQKAEDDAS
jgi:hypothetical protein